jgi:hypothetical protein
MNPAVTDKQSLITLAEKTFEALHQERALPTVQESAAESELESAQTELDVVANHLAAALDWARLEDSAEAGLESAESAIAEPYIPSNQTLSLLQSAYEEYLEANAGAAEAIIETPFDQLDPGWLTIAWEKLKALVRGKHEFIRHTDANSFHYDLPDGARVALFSDWGTGEPTAVRVMQQIRAARPTHAIHLGDIYYSGTPKEVNDRFLRIIEQHGPAIGTGAGQCRCFCLNANHDMYSGGYAYFDIVLRRFGQAASYFNLRHLHWQLIGLDSAHQDFGLRDPQAEWLQAQLQQAGRKNILMTHHQLFSPYDKRAQDRTLAKKTGALLGGVYAWFWGHEHKCIIMRDHNGIKARCIGHGAIPTPVPFGPPSFPDVGIEKVDERPSREGGETHGFALLQFQGKQIDVSYIDEYGDTFHTEKFSA